MRSGVPITASEHNAEGKTSPRVESSEADRVSHWLNAYGETSLDQRAANALYLPAQTARHSRRTPTKPPDPQHGKRIDTSSVAAWQFFNVACSVKNSFTVGSRSFARLHGGFSRDETAVPCERMRFHRQQQQLRKLRTIAEHVSSGK